jgi:hypothetical protein
MTRNKRLRTALALFALTLLVFFGCSSEVEERSTLTLHMETSAYSAKTIAPLDVPLEVTQFVIRGNGPDNSRFSTTTTKPSVTVSGLLIGQWTITAVGQNKDGVDIVEGSTMLQLKPEATTATLTLDTLKGTGAIDLTISWDASLISNPGFELTITSQNGATTVPTLDTSTLESGYIRFLSTTLAAGSYQVSGKLYSGTQKIAGFAEAVRVVDGVSAVAEITVNLQKTNNVPSTITLVNQAGTPVECTISGIDSEMAAGVPVTATVNATGDEPLDITWFLDGETVGTGSTYTFTPELGPHRLDVMAKGALLGSTGSAGIEFNAVLQGTTGAPVLMKQIANGTDNLKIGGKTQAAFLSDGKFLVWSEDTNTLQLCQLNRNDVQVVTTYSASNSTFTLTNIVDIAVDTDRDYVYIADNNGPKVTKYSYSPTSSTLTKICESNNNAWEYPNSTGPFDTIVELGRIAIDRKDGFVYLSTPNTTPAEPNVTTVYHPDATTTETMFYTSAYWAKDVSNVDKTQTMRPSSFDEVNVSADNNFLTAVDTSKDLVIVSKRYEEILSLLLQPLSTFHNGLLGLEDITVATMVDSTTLLVGTETTLTMINADFSSPITGFSNGNLYMGGDSELGGQALQGVTQLLQTPDGETLYVLATGSGNLLACRYANGELGFLGSISLGSFVPNEMVLSADQSVMLLTSDSSDTLWVLRIPTDSE